MHQDMQVGAQWDITTRPTFVVIFHNFDHA